MFDEAGIQFSDYFKIFRKPIETLSRHLKGAKGMMIEYLLMNKITVRMMFEFIALEMIERYDINIDEIYITLDFVDEGNTK